MAPRSTRPFVLSPYPVQRSQGSTPTGNQQQHDQPHVSQIPETPPSTRRLKRHRSPSLQDSPPSKILRREDQDSMDVDSEEFEYIEPPQCATPSTVEIFNTSDTERHTTPDGIQGLSFGGVVRERLDGSDDSTPSASSAYHTAVTSGSSGSSATKQSPDDPFTPGSIKSLPEGLTLPPSWPKSLSPGMLSDIDPNIPNLGMHYYDDSLTELWATPPLSYISPTHPQGPRDLALYHYACPYDDCLEPFGLSSKLDGYRARTLVEHVYRYHGAGPAVDLMSAGLRKRVDRLRLEKGEGNTVSYSLAYVWRSPGRDLRRASKKIARYLEEIGEWERTCRATISREQKLKRREMSHNGKGTAVVCEQLVSSSPEDRLLRESTVTPTPSPPESMTTPSNQITLQAERNHRRSIARVKAVLSSPTVTSWFADDRKTLNNLDNQVLELLDADQIWKSLGSEQLEPGEGMVID